MSVDEERRISLKKDVLLRRKTSFFKERRLFGVCTDHYLSKFCRNMYMPISNIVAFTELESKLIRIIWKMQGSTCVDRANGKLKVTYWPSHSELRLKTNKLCQ